MASDSNVRIGACTAIYHWTVAFATRHCGSSAANPEKGLDEVGACRLLHPPEQRKLPRLVRSCSGPCFGIVQRSHLPSCSRACVFVPVPSLLEFSLPPPQFCPICLLTERFASDHMDPPALLPLVSKGRPPDRRHTLFLSDEQLLSFHLAEKGLWQVRVKSRGRRVGA